MKILRSALLRAVCSIIVGVLLIQYPDNTVTWLTVAIGALFLLSGVISCVTWLNAARNASRYTITDARGRVVAGGRPPLPVVGIGSVVFGALLAARPTMFVAGLMYVLGAVLILGAVSPIKVTEEFINGRAQVIGGRVDGRLIAHFSKQVKEHAVHVQRGVQILRGPAA